MTEGALVETHGRHDTLILACAAAMLCQRLFQVSSNASKGTRAQHKWLARRSSVAQTTGQRDELGARSPQETLSCETSRRNVSAKHAIKMRVPSLEHAHVAAKHPSTDSIEVVEIHALGRSSKQEIGILRVITAEASLESKNGAMDSGTGSWASSPAVGKDRVKCRLAVAQAPRPKTPL